MAFLGPHLGPLDYSGGEHRYIPGRLHWHCHTVGGDTCLAFCAQDKTKREKSPSHFEQLRRRSAAYSSGWRVGGSWSVFLRSSGSLIMISLLMLSPPARGPTRRHGPDAGSAGGAFGSHTNILVDGSIGKLRFPYTRLGSRLHFGAKIARLMRGSYIRRGIVVVLVCRFTLLEKAGWLVLGAETTLPPEDHRPYGYPDALPRLFSLMLVRPSPPPGVANRM